VRQGASATTRQALSRPRPAAGSEPRWDLQQRSSRIAGMTLSPRNRVLAWWLGFGIVGGTTVFVAGNVARSLWPSSTALHWIAAVAATVAAQIAYRVIAIELGCKDMPMWPDKSVN
jgi:hypothetical protein